MVERLVDRTEKSAALQAALLSGQPLGDAVEVFVLPAIIGRHALHISPINNDTINLCTVSSASWPGLSRPSTSYCPRSKTWLPGTRPGMTKSKLRERRFGLADDRFEGRRLGDGKVREHLTVDHDVGLGEAGDEAAVIEPERAHRGIEALDPQRAECALAPLAVAVGVLV